MERLSPDTQATLLLVNRLGGSDVKPLTAGEYNAVAKELHNRGLRPGDLLRGPFDSYPIEAARLDALTSRGTALALCLEKWSQCGIRVVGRSEAHYPELLKTKLRAAAAPLLFYSGGLEILSGDAICIVGSRDATDAGLEFARTFGASCATQGFSVISGDAKGVDREAMDAALSAGGRVIGVLAEALSTAVLSKRNRTWILEDRLLLLSPYDPEARFTVAQAMDRNRYLYALASAAVIVDSDTKGGTWSGAVENQKHGWTPAIVRLGGETRAGNPRLAELGLMPLEAGASTIADEPVTALIDAARRQMSACRAPDLPFEAPAPKPKREPQDDAAAIFDGFIVRLRSLLADGPKSEAAITRHFRLEPEQVKSWLALAEQAHGLRRDGDEFRWNPATRAA